MKIGYARVSTADQSLDLQRDALTAAGCEKIFDDTSSGATTERKGLAAALAYARPGDVLMVWKLDRLGRSIRHLIDTVQGLQSQGIEFASLRESIDTTTSTGKLIFHLFAALAEFERDLVRERTQAGLQAARARGRVGGRPPVLEGERLEQARTLLADPRQKPGAIARTLGVSRATLYRHAGPKSGR
jgi:DNA invertase Pin-like site-specific DNA recombinase